MAHYTSKPVTVEAYPFRVSDSDVGTVFEVPGRAEVPGAAWTILSNDGSPYLDIPTRSGVQRCNNGDYIIREMDGNGWYPCAASIFEMKYEPVQPSTE